MPRPPSIQWYFKQYLGDSKVLAMDWDAVGMHHWLLNISYQETPPGSLPNDMAVIRRWLRSPSDDVWRRVQPQIFTAWSLRDDRWYNSGAVESCQRRDNYLSRYKVRKSNENGTKKPRDSMKTVDEDVVTSSPPIRNTVAIGFDVESFDGESAFSRLCELHPRPERSQRAEIAFLEAVEWLVKARQWNRSDSAGYIHRKARVFRDKTASWPDRSVVKGLCNWLRDKTFDEDEAFWEKGPRPSKGADLDELYGD